MASGIDATATLMHYLAIRGMLEQGRFPSVEEMSMQAGLSVGEVDAGLRTLEAQHGVVLHPHRCEPWIVHPFSASPTHTWVTSGRRGWWAPCLWCALGISTLAGGETAIHTRLGAESEDIRIPVAAGVPGIEDLWVLFPEPPSVAWHNVHHFCARLLPFRSPQTAADWCERHGFPQGKVIPIQQLGALARPWYARHADRDWTKWRLGQASEIFASAGLVGDFWLLDGSGETY